MSNAEQLSKLLGLWGSPSELFDFNRDGIVDAKDLSILMSRFDSQDPDPIGNPEDKGYDAKVICRWTSVPFVEIKQAKNVGVAAFHMNGIKRVEFYVNDQPPVIVTESTINPENNCKEYYITINPEKYEDGILEIRAIVYPNIGLPRVLEGGFEDSKVGGTRELIIRNGIHSMFLVCNYNETLNNNVYYASSTGDDSIADGTEQNPYKTIQGALGSINKKRGNCDGVTLYLAEGDYVFSGPKFPNKVTTINRYVTIQAAPDTNRDNVRIVSSILGGLATKLVCIRNITFYGEVSVRTPSSIDSFVWLDNCKSTGPSHETGGGFAAGGWSGVYLTNCEAENVRNCFRNATLAVNCKGKKFSDTPIGQDTVVINCELDEFIRNSNGDHADVFHWFYTKPGHRENRMIYGLKVTNFSLQGWQVNPIRNGGQQLDNVALVDVYISKDISNVAGSWWYMDTDHLLMDNVNLLDQTLRWKTHGQDEDGKMNLKNVVIQNSYFKSMTWLPPEVTLINTIVS